jgi:hypothetical protein
MATFRIFDALTDPDGNVYYRMHGEWLSAVGTLVPCPGPAHIEHRRAYIDYAGYLCWTDGGTFMRNSTGEEAIKQPSPRFLSADVDGNLYSYHDGVYSPVTPI